MAWRKALLWSGAALTALLTIALALPFLVDADDYRGEIAAAASDRLGRELRIEGPLSLSLLPRLALQAEDVALANAHGPGFSNRPMLRLRSFDAELALLELLSGRIEVARLVLHEPDILLERTEDGRRNWDFPDGAAGERATPVSSPAATEFTAERIAIEAGRLLYRDGESETMIEAIAAELRLASLQGPVGGRLEAAIAGQSYDAEFEIGRLGDTPTSLRLDARFGGRPVTFDGRVGATGDSVELSGELFAAGSRARLDLRASSDETTRIFGEVDIARLDLVAFREGEKNVEKGEKSAALEAIPLFLPETLEGELSLSIDEIAGAPVAAGPVSLKARLTGGRLAVESLDAAFAGDARLEARGSVTSPDGYADISLETALRVGELGALVDLPENWPEQAEMRGRLTLVKNRLGLTDIDARLGESRITGRAGAALTARPQLAAELTIDGLDLNRYLAVSDDADGAARSASRESGATFPAAERIDGGISLTVARLRYRNRDLGPATVEAQLRQGELQLDRLALGQEEEIRLTASGRIRDLAAAPSYDLDIETAGAGLDRALLLAGAEAGTALADAGGFGLVGRVSGTLQQTRFDFEGHIGELALKAAGQAMLAGTGTPSLEMQIEGRQASLTALAKQFGANSWPSSSNVAKPVALTGSLSHREGRNSGHGELRIGDGHIDFRAASEAEATTIDLDIAAPDLHRFMTGLGLAFEPKDKGLGGLDLKISGMLRGEHATFERIAGTIGPSAVSGSGEAELGGAVPVVALALEADTVPLDAFLPAKSETAEDPAQPPHWSEEPIDVAALEVMDGRLDLKARRLTTADFAFEDLTLVAESRGPRLTVQQLSGRLFGGQANIAASLDAAGELPRVETEIKLEGVDLNRLLTATIGDSPATGTAFFDGRYRGSGISERAIVSSLSGNGHLGADGGVIRGVDLVALNRRMGSLTTIADFARVTAATLGGGETAYRHVGFDLVADDGELQSENVMADVDGAEIDFSSRIYLPAWSTDSRARISLAAHPDAPPVGARISGWLADPEIAFSTERLEQWAVGRFGLAVSRALTSGEGVGVADFLFGGRPPAAAQDGATSDSSAQRPTDEETASPQQRSVGESLLRGMFGGGNRQERQDDEDGGGGGP